MPISCLICDAIKYTGIHVDKSWSDHAHACLDFLCDYGSNRCSMIAHVACRATTNEHHIIETTRHDYIAAMLKPAPDPSGAATSSMPLSVSANQPAAAACTTTNDVAAAPIPTCAPALAPSAAHCPVSSAAACMVTSTSLPNAQPIVTPQQPASTFHSAALTTSQTVQTAPQPAMQLPSSAPVNPAFLSVAAMMWESLMQHMGSSNG